MSSLTPGLENACFPLGPLIANFDTLSRRWLSEETINEMTRDALGFYFRTSDA